MSKILQTSMHERRTVTMILSCVKSPVTRKPLPSGPGEILDRDCHLDDRDLVDTSDSGSVGIEYSVLVLVHQLAKTNTNEEDDQPHNNNDISDFSDFSVLALLGAVPLVPATDPAFAPRNWI